jgi:excinuclease UvrABC nuclease subunit
MPGMIPDSQKNWVVYIAFDLDTLQAIYVGITKNIKRRYAQHCSSKESAFINMVKQVSDGISCLWLVTRARLMLDSPRTF